MYTEEQLNDKVEIGATYYPMSELLFVAFVLYGELHGVINKKCYTTDHEKHSDLFRQDVKEYVQKQCLGKYLIAVEEMIKNYCISQKKTSIKEALIDLIMDQGTWEGFKTINHYPHKPLYDFEKKQTKAQIVDFLCLNGYDEYPDRNYPDFLLKKKLPELLLLAKVYNSNVLHCGNGNYSYYFNKEAETVINKKESKVNQIVKAQKLIKIETNKDLVKAKRDYAKFRRNSSLKVDYATFLIGFDKLVENIDQIMTNYKNTFVGGAYLGYDEELSTYLQILKPLIENLFNFVKGNKEFMDYLTNHFDPTTDF